jgi:hypothetical protein
MYGVPADLPIQRFVGDWLFQVCICTNSVNFTFGSAGTICVYGSWELHDSSGKLIDCTQDHSTRDCYRVHVILNAEVVDFSIDPPRSFSLVFSTGHRLTIYDDSPGYESFAIQPDDIYV